MRYHLIGIAVAVVVYLLLRMARDDAVEDESTGGEAPVEEVAPPDGSDGAARDRPR